MAGFKTHIAVASTVGAVATTIIAMRYNFSAIELISFFIVSIISTTIPDLDSDTSKPLQISYNFLSFIIPIALLFYCYNYYNLKINNLIIIYLFSTMLIYVSFKIFMKFTTHRGIFHSIPMGIFISLLVLQFSFFATQDEVYSIMLSLFCLLGFNTHLLLDEFYSAKRLKKSFGSAFKIYSSQNILGSLLLYIFSIVLYIKINIPFSYYIYILLEK